jgi:Glycosyl hydrolase family 53
MSVSPCAERALNAGIRFSDGHRVARNVAELSQLFVAHGGNELHTELITRRRGRGRDRDDRSLNAALDRARIAADLEIPLNPLLGLWGEYGAIIRQPPPDFEDYPEVELPAEWQLLTIDQMADALRMYARVTARELLDTGVTVRLWDLGQEVEFGGPGLAVRPFPFGPAQDVDWYRPPDAVNPAIGEESCETLWAMPERRQIAWLETNVWPYLARQLAAARDGVRDVDANARVSTHISLSRPSDAFALAFWQAMWDSGFAVDEIGFSLYPSGQTNADSSLNAFKRATVLTQDRFGVPVSLTEFGYPARRFTEGAFVNWTHELTGYAMSDAGQAAVYADLAEWCAANGVSGLRPYAPDLIEAEWEPMAFFRHERGDVAVARPSLDAIAEGLAR